MKVADLVWNITTITFDYTNTITGPNGREYCVTRTKSAPHTYTAQSLLGGAILLDKAGVLELACFLEDKAPGKNTPCA